MQSRQSTTLELQGSRITSLDTFYDEVERSLLAPGVFWGRNLDAFNDILRGGFGTPEAGFVLRWKDSDLCRETLGYRETEKWLKEVVARCHPANRTRVTRELEQAQKQVGPTLFDILIEIIDSHGPRGDEAEDGVILELA